MCVRIQIQKIRHLRTLFMFTWTRLTTWLVLYFNVDWAHMEELMQYTD
jgi:hypothetical protein